MSSRDYRRNGNEGLSGGNGTLLDLSARKLSRAGRHVFVALQQPVEWAAFRYLTITPSIEGGYPDYGYEYCSPR